MDQDAFRQLLAEQAASASSSSSSSQRQFGKQAKRSIGGSGGDDEYGRRMRKEQQRVVERDSAAPPKRPHAAPDDSLYVDRADARRRGDEEANEFAEAERLRADFDARIAATNDDEERGRLREQMAFLGGDARHTILVKGLDYALLEQQKAKLADNDDAREKELESAYASTSKTGAEVTQKKLASKFKPIAQKRAEEEGVEAQPEYIWRNGKRMRKKKKKREEVDDAKEESKPLQAADLPKRTAAAAKEEANIAVEKQPTKSVVPPSPPDEPPEKKSASIEPSQASSEHAKVNDGSAKRSVSGDDDDDDNDDDDNDDEDIFADAGRWKGVEDDDDSDDDETASSTKPAPSAPPAGKRDWFATAGTAEEELIDDAAVLPAELATLIGHASDAQQSFRDDAQPSTAAEPRPTRLLGLSDSALDGEMVRYMLEREAEREEKRTAGGGGGDDDGGDKKPRKRKKKRGGGNDDSD